MSVGYVDSTRVEEAGAPTLSAQVLDAVEPVDECAGLVAVTAGVVMTLTRLAW